MKDLLTLAKVPTKCQYDSRSWRERRLFQVDVEESCVSYWDQALTDFEMFERLPVALHGRR